jgi:ABC-type bacteriocin/lantibiotic exporter with double-glycine peptidase domain
MVLATFGVAKSESELRELCDCTIFGTPAIELIHAARSLGFPNSRKFSLTIADLEEFTDQGYFPIVYVVVQLDNSLPDVHAMIVTSVLTTEVEVLDPKQGHQRITLREISKMWAPMRNVAVVIAR